MKNLVFALIAVIAFASCSSGEQKNCTEKRVKGVEHVVIIGCDAFGAYAYPKANIPNIKALAANGGLAKVARSVLPSSSAVNWSSMIMGASPSLHGYTEWGSRTPEIPSAAVSKYGKFPSIFNVIKDSMPNAKTAAIYSWGGIGYLFDKEVVDFNFHSEGNEDLTADSAVAIIKREKPLLTWVVFDQPDGAGHKYGHDTEGYYNELQRIDSLVGKVVEATKEAGIFDNTVFVLLGDHGGIDKGHGGKTVEEVNITWLISGKGAKKNYTIENPVIIYDTAPTIAWLFGLNMPEAWRGKPVKEAFNLN